MFRFFMCICLAAMCAGTALAQSATGGNGAFPTPGGGEGGNIFEELNKSYEQIKRKANGKNINDVRKMLDDNLNGQAKGPVAKSAAAICPICKEMLYRHSEDGFRCIPKDVDGNAMSMAEIVWKKTQCPVCQAQFLGAMPGNANSKNGLDRDFCAHSIGKACVQSNVWTCPDCGYAAQIGSFGLSWDGKPISEETKAFVRKDVSPVMFVRMCKLSGIKEDFIKKGDAHNLRHFSEFIYRDDMQQDPITDWIKYDNAIKIYKQQKAPSTLMAQLYYEAACACRREMNGEIAVPVLHSTLEERLSYSIRRIQHDLTAATIEIRRQRNETKMIDPNKSDTDSQILCEAAEMIIKMGEFTEERITAARNPRAGVTQGYTTGDMFVLCLRYAGFLDRMGRFEDANKALNKAKGFIPPDANSEAMDAEREAVEFATKQLRLLRDFVDGRKKCLELENECLNRAMWENLVAIHHKQVRFVNPNSVLAVPEKGQLDSAWTAYMIGELARRCNEPAAAPAFFTATDAILDRQFAELDKEEKAIALKKDAPEVQTAAIDRSKKLGERWSMLRVWVAEQRKLALAGGKLDATVKEVLDEVLQSAGIDPAKFTLPNIPVETAVSSAPAPKVSAPAAGTAPAAPATANAGGIKTRDALYAMYYDAISRYVKEKKSNPPSLDALVQGGYISAENSCLTEKGSLICPETNEPLQYSKGFTFGDAQGFVLYRTNNPITSKILFANGEVRTPVQKK